MRIAILALQGAFIEHERMMRGLGCDVFEIRKLSDWNQPKDGLIIPGGESTVQSKLLNELGLSVPIRNAIISGLPVMGTCAGLILLAEQVENGNSSMGLSTMSIEVCRNAYGRQLGSFYVKSSMKDVGEDLPMVFIRAPYIKRVYGNARVMAEHDGRIVAARQENQLVTSFHPELTEDDRVHRYFLDMVREYGE